ncbi:MAG: chorismate mutase [Chloroflexi bacterium]|nr:chorismate mutase [Chloroflexota bacterium]
MACRGIRGATTVEDNSAVAILAATRELLSQILKGNDLSPEDVASAVFTVTPDLTAVFPAQAARELGWQHMALLDAQEIPVPGSLPRCVRVLVHCNTDKSQAEMRHIYLRGAVSLRPDLAQGATAARKAEDDG